MGNKDIDKALVILRNTKDGDELSPTHLKILEMYINGQLNELGLREFDKIYESVASGAYVKPWYHGVEHMTHDHEGYVYFKGQHVEHFSNWWAHSLDAKAALIRLQQKCLFLESKGVEVNSISAAWGWEKYAAEFGELKKAELERLIPSGEKIIFSEIAADVQYGDTERFLMSGRPDESEARTSPYYCDLIMRDRLYGNEAANVTVYAYGSGAERNASDKEMAALELCFGYLKDNGLLPAQEEILYPGRGNEEQEVYGSGYDENDEDEYER